MSDISTVVDRFVRRSEAATTYLDLRRQLELALARTHWDPAFSHQSESCECCTQTELLAMREDRQRAAGTLGQRVPRRRKQ